MRKQEWIDKPDKEGYWWLKVKPDATPDVVSVGYDWKKRLVFFYPNEELTNHWESFHQQCPEAKWQYVPYPEDPEY